MTEIVEILMTMMVKADMAEVSVIPTVGTVILAAVIGAAKPLPNPYPVRIPDRGMMMMMMMKITPLREVIMLEMTGMIVMFEDRTIVTVTIIKTTIAAIGEMTMKMTIHQEGEPVATTVTIAMNEIIAIESIEATKMADETVEGMAVAMRGEMFGTIEVIEMVIDPATAGMMTILKKTSLRGVAVKVQEVINGTPCRIRRLPSKNRSGILTEQDAMIGIEKNKRTGTKSTD